MRRNSLNEKLLILDLDETLIYATEEKSAREPDFSAGQYFVYKRPFLDEFLEFCFENFEVAVWTSSTRNYVVEIAENIFGSKYQTMFLWARERCTISYDIDAQENYLEKKMSKVRRHGYDLKSVIVVDDSPEKWRSAYGNPVNVKPFFGEMIDDELKHLIIYLQRLKTIENIRQLEKRNWRNRI